MNSSPTSPPSFWTGLAASTFPFEDTVDYSRWACSLLEKGLIGHAIGALAGMEDENNLFVLREWHRKALADLGLEAPTGRDALLAHARGLMEEFLHGRSSVVDLLSQLNELHEKTGETRLDPFVTLHFAWWNFDDADWGIESRNDIPIALRKNCTQFIEDHEAAQSNGFTLQLS